MTSFIWDLDGTLLDSYEAILAALSETFVKFDRNFSADEVRQEILRTSTSQFLRQNFPVKFDEVKKYFSAELAARNSQVKVMPGARAVLQWTQSRGIQNFVYTHKGKNAQRLLDDLGLTPYFTEIVSSANGFAKKPAPDAIFYLMEKYQLSNLTTYYIGDRALDVAAAENAHIHSINLTQPSSAHNLKISKLEDLIGGDDA